MHWTVVVEVEGQVVSLSEHGGQPNLVELRIDSKEAAGRISHGQGPDSSWGVLDRLQIATSPNAAVDLLRFAAVVYSVDCRLARKEARDAWARSIDLHLPVVAVDKWKAAKTDAEDLLRFLTGDAWELHFSSHGRGRPEFNSRLRKKETRIEATAVCLLSGGLDSFIGAANALASGERLYLVSHNQGKYTSRPQADVVKVLRRKFGEDSIRHYQVGVHPPSPQSLATHGAPVAREISMRSRSLLFFAYGVLLAASLDEEQPLLIPENGFITINPPLASSRAGSHSTRTTHPYTIVLFERLLKKLDLPVPLRLDYRFQTKGEMLVQAREPSWVQGNALLTASCGKANFAAIETNGRLHQCGGCVPCIIRRSALHAAGVTGEQYAFQQLNMDSSEDVRAFAIALERFRTRPESLLAQVVGTGPIHPDEAEQYLDVVRRGFSEVESIL